MTVGAPEIVTQKRIIKLFQEELGYAYIGDKQYEDNNSNVEQSLLIKYLERVGYTKTQIDFAIRQLTLLTDDTDDSETNLVSYNMAVYKKLRYGADVKVSADANNEKVHYIDWEDPEANDFAIAEEVTLKGENNRRPDLVLYINGIAVGVIELKRSYVSVGDGIRQLISNQQAQFHKSFFNTVQLVFAGNDTEGLRYSTIKTEEKFFLEWKENEEDNSRYKIDKHLLLMCSKHRLIELIHDFVLFDAGQKKVPRVHQYMGIKKAQEHVLRKEGGIIWHTQGSGKSIVMVLLAKWIVKNNPNARVVVITDRNALDKQIEGVFKASGENIYRTQSGPNLMQQLSKPSPRILCTLIHKFGQKETENFEALIKELEASPSEVKGELFVFVDECHRTQSGKLNRTMKALLPKESVFIGFTGTPLLKSDKQTSKEVFGGYIHTYKFGEAVADKVILDLQYEARDVDQRLGSQEAIDEWFERCTENLNEWQKAELRERWGTLQKVLSSKSRIDRIVYNIVQDFMLKPRLRSERGTAIFVASSIHEATMYFQSFQNTMFRGKCGIVTSYNPHASDVTTEDTGANTDTAKEFIYNTYIELLRNVSANPGTTKAETYESNVRTTFIDEPVNMKLLIVVDKLLTGFDAPSCTYLYIDKSMQDHGLFQAICRTNRLDGEDKDFGYIVDYKDLFKKVESAISVYTSELDDSADDTSPDILMNDRLEKSKEKLDESLEQLELLTQDVPNPRSTLEYIQYYCGNTEIQSDIDERQPRRSAFYKSTATFVRAYANLADELLAAGYSEEEIRHLKARLDHFVRVRREVRFASGEVLDMKAYEADMRQMIDMYIDADAPRQISPFDDMSLLEIITKLGIDEAIQNLPDGIRGNQTAVSETIENNVRRRILQENLTNPAYYEEMSRLLDEIIQLRKDKALEYEAYLEQIADIARRVETGQSDDTPETINTPGLRALFNNLDNNADLALEIDETVKRVRPDSWRGEQTRENVIKTGLFEILNDESEVERIFKIIVSQREY